MHSGSNATHDTEKLNSLLEHLLQTGLIADGVVAVDSSHVTVIAVLVNF